MVRHELHHRLGTGPPRQVRPLYIASRGRPPSEVTTGYLGSWNAPIGQGLAERLANLY